MNRNRNLTATMDDGDTTTVDTITEARRWAESHGTADGARTCYIYSGLRMVAMQLIPARPAPRKWKHLL